MKKFIRHLDRRHRKIRAYLTDKWWFRFRFRPGCNNAT